MEKTELEKKFNERYADIIASLFTRQEVARLFVQHFHGLLCHLRHRHGVCTTLRRP